MFENVLVHIQCQHLVQTLSGSTLLYVYELRLLCPGVESIAVELQLGEMAAKLETTVRDCVLTFVSVIPLNTFNETSGQFFAEFMVTKPGILSRGALIRH